MAKPPQSELVQIKLRAKEDLRAALQAAADAKGTSLNGEIVDRLQRSLEGEASIDNVFDSPLTAAIAKLIASAMHEAGRYAGFAATGTTEGATDWFNVPY